MQEEYAVNKYLIIMGETDLLKSLSKEQISAYLIDGSFKIAAYGKNSVIHFEGEICSKLDIILSGKVVVERIDQSGGLMTVAEFYGNDILGGNLLFSKNPHYPMTITAQKPAVILEINKARLFQLFSDNHQFLRTYLELVSDHAFILGDKIKHYVNRTIRESIINFLKYESKMQNTNRIKLNMTKKALAEKIGIQRTSLSRELAKMRNDGLIVYDSQSIELLNTKQQK